MTVGYHVDEKTEVKVYNIGDDVQDIIKVRNPYENEVTIFGDEKFIKELHKQLTKHIRSQKKAGRYE